MLSSDAGESDLFFDSVDRLSVESSSSVSEEELVCGRLDYQIWLNEPQSVVERRQNFLRGMGLIDLESRIADPSGAVSSSSASSTDGEEENLVSCGRDVNTEAKSMVEEMETETEAERFNVNCKNENLGPSSPSIEESGHFEVEEHNSSNTGKKKIKSWWKYFVNKRKRNESKSVSKSDHIALKSNRIKVKQNRKKCMEFTGLYMEQQIQAHKGYIGTMKFSLDGQYLATGGQDGVVRIWRVTSVDSSSCTSFTFEVDFGGNLEEGKSKFSTKKMSQAPLVIPEKVFQLEESPFQEFHGHVGEVLDLAWSKENNLLSSSIDKTVRLWQVGSSHCLNVFHHSNYVTCIQFNPVDENYFISGSIDGKVRIWGVSEGRVVDWTDVRDVISAVCYQPDGEGFVVGSTTGICRFYEVSDNYLQLEAEIHIQGRKKTSGNRITGIQFCQERSERVMITSEDSKLRIFDRLDIACKFKGLPKSGSQMSASFTSTGRHIISVGEDSHVYVWNYDGLCSPSPRHKKSLHSCEHFFSEGVSVAAPWSGTGTEPRTPLDCYSFRSNVQTEEAGSCRRDSERFSLGNWLFMEGPCRGSSATWPEEKLPLFLEGYENQQPVDLHRQQQVLNCNDQTALSEAWGLVIVTAGWDGTIRTFHNYGLPIRL